MKPFHQFIRPLSEATTPDTKLTVTARDPDGTLRKLLDCIRKTGNGGHSFSIVVDPGVTGTDHHGLSLKERTFYWDGDGPDRIVDIE